jgi:hypothetical protein
MTYTLTQDSLDHNPSDNEVSTLFYVGGSTFALEDGFTRSVSVAESLYDTGAPPSYAYGNYFRPVQDARVERILWGVKNPNQMAGKTVQISLLQWTDNNKNNIADSQERHFIGFAEYTFTDNEGDNAIFETVLENFDNPGETVRMEGGIGYIVMIEYQAQSSDDPQFFMLASDARDYTPQQIAMDSAVAHGLADMPAYFSVLGWSADGNIANIDYEVRELDLEDSRVYFGDDIVPMIRIVTTKMINTHDVLGQDNLVSTYPNPATDVINIDFGTSLEHVSGVVIFNGAGQKMMEFNNFLSQISQIDISGMENGVYFIEILTTSGVSTTRIIKH